MSPPPPPCETFGIWLADLALNVHTSSVREVNSRHAFRKGSAWLPEAVDMTTGLVQEVQPVTPSLELWRSRSAWIPNTWTGVRFDTERARPKQRPATSL